MPISSLLVRTAPDARSAVADRLGKWDGVTVTDRVRDALVVVTETLDSREDRRLLERIEGTPGVVAAALVYHNFEDQEDASCLTV